MNAIKKVFTNNSNDGSADEPMYMGKGGDVSGTGSGTTIGRPGSNIIASGGNTVPTGHTGTTGASGTGLSGRTHDTVGTTGMTGMTGTTGTTTGATGLGSGPATTDRNGPGGGVLAGGHGTDKIPAVDREGQLPVREGVTGRHEESGNALRTAGAGAGGAFTNPHGLGHSTEGSLEVDPNSATHDHKHFAPVTHENVRHTEVEEVLRQKEHERHVHHVQHHVQPVLDKQVNDEVHHERSHPVTEIRERHHNTDKDHASFAALNTHRDETTHAPKERQIVDLGETVNEQVHHHVHHVTQPVIEREVHDRHRIHTVIPTHHVTHEAPIVHASSTHNPMHISDFLSKGGKLDSNITHDNSGVLTSGECEREVDGVGERLAEELHLKSGTTANEHQGTTRV